MINKYFSAIKEALNTTPVNNMRVIDMFKTTSELYAHSQENLTFNVLYPESDMCVKYHSDYYRPTACFKMTHTFTITPINGTFFLSFMPGTLYEKSSGKSSYAVSLNDNFTTFKGEMVLKPKDKTLGGGLLDGLANAMNNLDFGAFKDYASSLFEKGTDELKTKGKKAVEDYINKKDKKSFIDDISNIISNTSGGGTKTGFESISNGDMFAAEGVIDEYRIPCACIKMISDDMKNKGVLISAVTYVHKAEDVQKYSKNPQLLTQEWVNKVVDKPEADGVRIIKLPRDESDHKFKKINHMCTDAEQVIMICGKNLDTNSVILVDIIQHIEFIPRVEFMEMFKPTIPMFTLGSKELFRKTVANFPIIGQNGSLIINSPKKLDALMEYLKKYPDLNTSLWNILTDTSYITDENITNMVNNLFY